MSHEPQPPQDPNYQPPQSPSPYAGYPSSPPPYVPGQPVYQQFVVAAAPPASGWSIASLIFGIIGVLGGFCVFGLPCIVAVICGHIGLGEAKRGVKSGRGLAIAGLIMGYLFIIPAVIFIVTGGIGSAFS